MKSLSKAILLVVLVHCYAVVHAQSDSIVENKRSFGYGVSNLLDLYDITNYRPGIYLEFGQVSPIEKWNYNIKFIGNYQYSNQNNIRYHSIIPFIVTVGLERVWEMGRIAISINADLFYSMSLRKTSISGFQGDDYGVGLAPGINLIFPLRDNLVLIGGAEYGVGFFRKFNSLGTVTTPSLVLDVTAIRNLSFGIRHYF